MRRATALGGLALLAVAVALLIRGPDRPAWVEPLIAAIHGAADDGSRVIIRDHTGFSWDEVYFFAPYADPDHVDRALGFTWTGRDLMERDEHNCLVAFVEGEAVVEHAKVPRRDVGCLEISAHPFDRAPDAWTPRTARFTVTTEPARGGGLLYHLHRAPRPDVPPEGGRSRP